MEVILNIVNYPDRIAYQKRGNEKILYQEEGVWLTMDQGNGYVYALASTQRQAEKIFQIAEAFKLQDLIIHGSMLKQVRKQIPYDGSGEAYRYATYVESISYHTANPDVCIRLLTQTDIPFVCAYYSYRELAIPDYIKTNSRSYARCLSP